MPVQLRGLNMLTLKKIEQPKNQFCIQYKTCHTDIHEHDIWMTLPPYIITGVENLDDLSSFLECFKVIQTEITKSRTGYGYAGNDIDFETLADEAGCEKMEWYQDDGVMVIKDGKEFFIDVGTDIGMPTEDGRFMCGIDIEVITYFDQDGIEHIVENES